MKRKCDVCGGIPIFPPNKKVEYNKNIGAWICSQCLKSQYYKIKEWREENKGRKN